MMNYPIPECLATDSHGLPRIRTSRKSVFIRANPWLFSRHAGFTLLELMVAVAILATVMSGILLLFSGTLRAVKQGNQSLEAYEEARGAIGVVERDLTSAFTSREHGHYYTFYGMPQGMVFIGAVQGKAGTPVNLSRVTYAIHNSQGAQEFETTWPNPNPAPLPGEEFIDVLVQTRALIRYVEPAITDLETFKYDWPNPLLPAPGEVGSPEYQVWYELGQAGIVGGASGMDLFRFLDPENQNVAPEERILAETLLEELLKAKKRELWIRMIAGDPALPNIWQLLLDGNGQPKNPRDYVVAENIVWKVIDKTIGQTIYLRKDEDPNSPIFFRYGRTAFQYDDNTQDALLTNDITPYFNAADNLFAAPPGALDTETPQEALTPDEFWETYAVEYTSAITGAEVEATRTGDPLRPRLPEFAEVEFTLFYPSNYPGTPDFNRTFSLMVDIPSAYTRTVRKQTLPDTNNES